MVNTDKIIGLIAEHHYTRDEIAKKLGISSQTLRRKLANGVFDSDEMEKLISILHIEKPCEIFFTNIGA